LLAFVILRVVTVAPDAVPASRPMLNGVVSEHWTWIVEVALVALASTPEVPKSSVLALLMMHDAVIVIWTVNVVVVVAANALPLISMAPKANGNTFRTAFASSWLRQMAED
jgi:hypothetical protein